MSVEVFCWDCGSLSTVASVRPDMRHECGSRELDLWDGSEDQRRRVAALQRAARTPEPTFTEFMRTAQGPVEEGEPTPAMHQQTAHPSDPYDPDTVNGDVPGWAIYTGPPPKPNPRQAPPHHGDTPSAPVTHTAPEGQAQTNYWVYDKHDPRPSISGNPRDPNTPHVPEPYVKRHPYPSTQTTIPFLGQRAPELKGASCPRCGVADTTMLVDDRQDAHWYCRAKCGSLVNLDRHPTVDPYRPPATHPWGADGFKKGRKLISRKKTGQVLARMSVIAESNPALTVRESLHLARQSVIAYPEV